ncbi:MAG: hypothetical protein K2N56_03695, partial [Oscillospiraceae bacterium]|nr:hypothetical protein [Oscillospiraceae bacterium]
LVRLIPKYRDLDVHSFAGLIDYVSISLNAPNAARYNEVTRPSYGEKAFDEMLRFAEDMKSVCEKVMFTVVDVISSEEIGECQALADRLGIPLRVRHWVTDNESYT